jgi:hypothetical protein
MLCILCIGIIFTQSSQDFFASIEEHLAVIAKCQHICCMTESSLKASFIAAIIHLGSPLSDHYFQFVRNTLKFTYRLQNHSVLAFIDQGE